MIVGSGSLAKLLNDRKGFLFCASGVGDSSETDQEEFKKELVLLYAILYEMNVRTPIHFVYFSTISIYTAQTPYTIHKREMELVIKNKYPNYTIIRLGNIWECTNPHTFINAYKTKPYEPRNEFKYMISKEQLNFITDNLPLKGKHEISIFGEMLKVKECLIK